MIRIGLLGASRIAVGAIIQPAHDVAGVEVSAVAARDPGRASEFAATHSIPSVAEDYNALVNHPDVDLVYNALPPSGHKDWSVAALQAGKHVLCEKPFAMNADEAAEMVSVAKASAGVLIEAFHYRFHPFFERVLEICRSGDLGALQTAYAEFNIPIRSTPGELRYMPELGGGALMDLGCYPLHWLRTVLGSEPDVVRASSEFHSTGVDISTSGELLFDGNIKATFSTSMSEDLPDKLEANLMIAGENGVLQVENSLAPHLGNKLTLRIGEETHEETVDGDTTYHYQLRHVLDVIAGKADAITGGKDAVAEMELIDKIRKAWN